MFFNYHRSRCFEEQLGKYCEDNKKYLRPCFEGSNKVFKSGRNFNVGVFTKGQLCLGLSYYVVIIKSPVLRRKKTYNTVRFYDHVHYFELVPVIEASILQID